MTNVETEISLYTLDKPLPQGAVFSYKPQVITSQKFIELVLSGEYFLLIIPDKARAQQLLQAKLPAQPSSFRVVVLDNEYTASEVSEFLNAETVIKILKVATKPVPLDEHIRSALETLQNLKESENIISKVRTQNRVLSEINENLEGLVQQRTENLEHSKVAVESTLRAVRDLIKFVKNLSQINNFDDLIILLRQEFIKLHKVRPPLLVYSLGGAELRCIFFQGPQIIDQVLTVNEKAFFNNDSSNMRETLANALERPMSPIIALQFMLNDIKGALIFEHSFNEEEQQLFYQILAERTESLRVAFERLALKWRAHLISRQWSATFDLLKDPILIIDRDFRVVRSNKNFNNYSGDRCFKVFANRQEPCVGCPAIKAMADGQSNTGKIHLADKTFEVGAFPIVVEELGDSSNWIVHYKDVTHSVNLQGQLVQSEKMAAIGMLAGNIAHELNNPLTGIKSLAQILLSEVPKDSAIYADLKEVQGASERCEQIIKNLLEFSSGKSKDLEVSSLRDVVAKTLPLLKTALYTFNTSIELADDNDGVFVDPQLLQQVIFNLVNNACQAMGTKGHIFIVSEVSSDKVRLRVRDTGPGVPAHLRQDIFAPFFTTKEEGQGTGLGLSVSRSIVEKFKGKLYLNEDILEGSEFVIELPRSES